MPNHWTRPLPRNLPRASATATSPTVCPEPVRHRPPPIRLRTILGGLLILGGGWCAVPRVLALFRLHDAGTALAEYALCMVGPTGPSRIRDDPAEFGRLVRRRLVAALPDERPFARCAKSAEAVTRSPEVNRAHLATAASFVDYGGSAADRALRGSRGELTLAQLDIGASNLAAAAERAWPFAPKDVGALIKSSAGGFEAVHPLGPARPGPGRGLPGNRTAYRATLEAEQSWLAAFGAGSDLVALRSRDQGVTWSPLAPDEIRALEFAERCPAGNDRAFTFGANHFDGHLTVTSRGPENEPHTVALAGPGLRMLAAACDDTGLVAAMVRRDSSRIALRLCRYGGQCRDLKPPAWPPLKGQPHQTLDVARVQGVTILAISMHGIVRVTNSKNDGRRWSPFATAFDSKALVSIDSHGVVPDRLLALGRRLLLYGAVPVPNQQTYPLLTSDNFGASWQSPSGPNTR
ncbi:hypothetical protein ACFL5O_06955 [Myxococcota bacterium]